ncbi:cell wall-binding repeat-containing protein [Paramicrobacterium humi]|nr:cell wall-binding repeat-containing protein [Microbacterium humi]
MTESEIQSFLNSKVSTCKSGYTCLKSYKESTKSRASDKYCSAYTGGSNESAARIIYKVARACGMNPQVLLVTLQKEQGLVTSTAPTAGKYRIAMGYACPDTAACDTKYYGFSNQVYNAARQLHRYTVDSYFSWFPVGKTVGVQYHPNASCGKKSVYIETKATAALYYYTPYTPNTAALNAGYGTGDTCSSYGNRNFFNYFNAWFGSTWTNDGVAPQLAGIYTSQYSELGKPQGNPIRYADGGVAQAFERGWAYWSKATGAHYSQDQILTSYTTLKGPEGVLGYPTGDVKNETGGGLSQQFQKGALYWSPGNSIHRLSGQILKSYLALGGPSGKLGYPVDAESSLGTGMSMQPFVKGALYYSTKLGIHFMSAQIKTEYDKLGGVKSALGFPTDSTRSFKNGMSGQTFQSGSLYWSSAHGPVVTTRHYGADRYATGASVSRSTAQTKGKVYIATGANYPDALGAAALAGKNDASLLLVTRTSVPGTVASELKRLAPSQIVIVGGTGVVSSAVEKSLKSYAPVSRISGSDRFETSRNTAKQFGAAGAQTAFISTGWDFPDALTAGSAAGSLGAPVILVDGKKSALDAKTSQVLKTLKVQNIVIVGGTGVVSSGISSALSKSGYGVSRLSGADRYATAAAINSKYFPTADAAYFATGTDFADALTGSAAAGADGAPLYITTKSCIPASNKNAITKQSPTTVRLLGGPAVVGDQVGRLEICG